MATKSPMSFEQYAALEEPVGERWELSHGELIVTPSATLRHNEIRDRVNVLLRTFPEIRKLGVVCSELDTRLAEDTVRRPDVMFFRAGKLDSIDLDRVPIPVAPDLAIEIVSQNDRADDLMQKVSDYLLAGVQAVWLMYPKTGLAYRYSPAKREPEVYYAATGDTFTEPDLLPGFSMLLSGIFAYA